MKFEIGKKYATRSICNHDCIFEVEVLKRTAKTVTICEYGHEVKRVKVHVDTDGREFIFPHGQYSMAAVIRADETRATI